MSYLILRLKKKLIFRLDLGEIVPDKLKNKKKNVKNLKIFYGNEEKKLSDFFSFQGKLNKGIIFKGNLGKCDYIGNSMKEGEIIVNGSVGEYLGNKMENGKILVKGSAGNYAACSLKGGEILIEKNTAPATTNPKHFIKVIKRLSLFSLEPYGLSSTQLSTKG